MIVEILAVRDGSLRPLRFPAGQLILRTDDGTPVAIAVSMDNGAIDLATSADKDLREFRRLVKEVGESPVAIEEFGVKSPDVPGASLVLSPW